MDYGFAQNTRDEYFAQIHRATAEENERAAEREVNKVEADYCRTEKAKEVDKKRQRRHRQKLYNAEIVAGERSPGGTKVKKVSTILVH